VLSRFGFLDDVDRESASVPRFLDSACGAGTGVDPFDTAVIFLAARFLAFLPLDFSGRFSPASKQSRGRS
jgi:hypothetical protein